MLIVRPRSSRRSGRNSFASWGCPSGSRLGHPDDKVTDRYIKASGELFREEARLLEERLGIWHKERHNDR